MSSRKEATEVTGKTEGSAGEGVADALCEQPDHEGVGGA